MDVQYPHYIIRIDIAHLIKLVARWSCFDHESFYKKTFIYVASAFLVHALFLVHAQKLMSLFKFVQISCKQLLRVTKTFMIKKVIASLLITEL